VSILIAMPNRDPQPLLQAMQSIAPEIAIDVWPELADPAAVKMAVVWQHPKDLLVKLTELQVVHSFGAGVEHILNDATLAKNIQVARVSGPKLAASMTEYLVQQVQASKIHFPNGSPAIGILGYGQLAQSAAAEFLQQGLSVMAWRRNAVQVDNVTIYNGPTGLIQMLQQTDVLICLLPLTAATTDIISKNSLAYAKPGMYLINVGRGAHVVEADLLAALDSGQLSGACLDVTRHEPIAPEDPLVHHVNIKLTQHTASLTDPVEATGVIVENYHRLLSGKALKFAVNRQLGY